jgi:signal transduction histidine kinase
VNSSGYLSTSLQNSLMNHNSIQLRETENTIEGEFHTSLEKENSRLEYLVKRRTEELKQAFNFEALVRRITEKIRDTLDESQVLQTASKELAEVLGIEVCKIELYQKEYSRGTIAYEYSINQNNCQGTTRPVVDFPEIYQCLLQKQLLQYVNIVPEWNHELIKVTRLACPIFDDKGILGNLWLVKPKEELFSEFEIRLVQQIANECAIAIRQARLYQSHQGLLKEFDKLEYLKNDFLKTLSHELRTPITSIRLAVETLETLIKDDDLSDKRLIYQLLQILQEECKREGDLINDLLTLTYLEAGSKPLTLNFIDLKTWLSDIVESFKEMTFRQNQNLRLEIDDSLPFLETDMAELERIVRELITNACKYTPKFESITVRAIAVDEKILISITNSGIEIPVEEQKRIFDAFYRIPKNDPFKYGGTGLGLALVKKLAKYLGAEVFLDSVANNTKFSLIFPIG